MTTKIISPYSSPTSPHGDTSSTIASTVEKFKLIFVWILVGVHLVWGRWMLYSVCALALESIIYYTLHRLLCNSSAANFHATSAQLVLARQERQSIVRLLVQVILQSILFQKRAFGEWSRIFKWQLQWSIKCYHSYYIRNYSEEEQSTCPII